MARQRISLVSEEVKSEATLESKIRSGEITADNFSELSAEEQAHVNGILFKMASEKINPNQGASAIEFTLFGFMRVMTKKIQGMSLTEDEKEIEAALNRIMGMHEITNDTVTKSDWLFDYMGYAESKAFEILGNRKEHIERKQQVTGKA
jgi:hypothetical protein